MAKPNVTLLGSTTINAGEQTNLYIRENGNFNALPITYQLSDGYSGELSRANPASASPIVSPSTTAEYTIVSVYNQCGPGVFSGKVTVKVNPPSEKGVILKSWRSVNSISALCREDSIRVFFSTLVHFLLPTDLQFRFQIAPVRISGA